MFQSCGCGGRPVATRLVKGGGVAREASCKKLDRFMDMLDASRYTVLLMVKR